MLLCVVGGIAPHASLAAPPPSFAVEDVLTGLEQPMTIRFLPDGRMLLLLKKGKILIANVGSVPASFELYLDLAAGSHADGIKADQERGLIDIAIDPNFPSSPYIYLFYTPQSGPNGQRSRIARFTHVNNSGGLSSRANPSSEVILWEDTEGYDSCCHFGGGLDFGPDGKLWLTVGDHFQGSYASSVEHAGGSVHRINKNGTIPADNPYADGAGPNVDSLFAIGLRNPFRARWDVPSGRFFIAEVGGNTQAVAWEDLHMIRYDEDTDSFIDADWGTAQDNFRYDGINFGWPTVEGLPPHNDFPGWNIDPVVGEPVFAYRHAGVTAAINGGVVYRSTQFPTAYRGAYFYADSTRDFIRYLKFDADGAVVPNPNPDSISPANPDSISHAFDIDPVGRIVCLEVGPDGSLYTVSFTDSGGAYGQPNPSILGAVRRYVYDGGNSWPVLSEYSVDPDSGASPLDASFRIRAMDPESQPMTYTLDFGDGNSWGPLALPANTTVTVPHTYAVDGAYAAHLEVSDGTRTTTEDLPLLVGTPPVITSLTANNARSGAADTSFRFGDTITFAATAADAEDGTLGGAMFSWSIVFVRPGNTHPTFGPESGTTSIQFPIPNQGQGFSDAVYYRCFLTVTDSSGLTTSDHIDIFPEKSDISFNTAPTGINVQVDGNTSQPAPYTMDSLVNYDHVITVPESQCLNGTLYVFSHWSNGPTTPQQVYTVPPTDASLTAVYTPSGPCTAPPSSGLVLHLRSDLGVVTSNSIVQAWEDQSGNNNVLSAVGNPRLVDDLVNDRPAIRFDGIDDALTRTGLVGFPAAAADRSMFMAVRYLDPGSGNPWVGLAYGTAKSNQAFGLTLTSAGILGVQGWGTSNDTLSNPQTGGPDEWLVQGAIYNDGALTQYKNGNLIGTRSRTFATVPTLLRLGEELNGGKNLNMEVAEILVYDRALTPEERSTVTEYLSDRYIDGSTPANTAPTTSITAPPSGSSHVEGTSITLTATATDAEDGNLGAAITWSSSRDGALGTGASLSISSLSVGSHTITASVTDSGDLADSDTITLAITAAPTGGPPTSGLVMHLRSDAGVTRSGNQVTAWQDQTANNNDLSAVGAPQFDAGLANGLPAIRFDGVDDALARTGFTGLPTGATNRTMYLVVRYNGTGTAGNGWVGFAYGSPSQNQTFGLTISPGGVLGVQGWGGANDFLSSPPSNGLGAWLVHSAVLSGNQLTQYRSGSAIGTGTHTYATGTSRIRLGEEINGNRNVPMDVAEVIVYNRALTAQERADVDAYLSQRYDPGSPPPPPDDEPITPTQPIALFNGSSLTGLYPWFEESGASDPNQVYRVQNGLLHVSGDGWGGLSTQQSYRNYQAVLEFKFGTGTFGPRVNAAKDAGLCIHSNGPDGGWQNLLIPHLQVQMMEGAMGDLMALPQTVGGGSNPTTISFQSRYDQITCASGNTYCRGGYVHDPSGPLRTFSGNLATQHWFGFDPDWTNVTGYRGDIDLESPDGEWNQLVVVANGPAVSVYLNGVLVNAATNVAPAAGKLQLEVEWAEFFVRRWELLPLGAGISPLIVNESVPAGTVGSSYSAAVKAVGGAAPLSWSVTSGSLPGGLSLNTSTGMITGTPSAAGTSTFTARVTDTNGLSRTQVLEIVVQPGSSSGDLPTDGLVLQLESDLNVSLQSGTTVAGWLDQSGWGNDLVAGGNPQIATAGTPSGLPAIRFDGIDDRLAREHASSPLGGLPTGNANRSIFVVAKYNGPANVGAGVSYGTGTQNRAFGLMARKTTGELSLQGWGSAYDLHSTQPGVGAGWLVQSAVLSNGQATLYKNGTQIAQRSGTYATGLTRLVIAEEIKHLGYLDMEVAAVLIYDRALDATQRAAVDAYLNAKYIGDGD